MTEPNNDGSEQVNSVRDISSARPFLDSAQDYLDNGWSPFPLPDRRKYPPRTGFTGYSASVIDQVQVDEFVEEVKEGYSVKIGDKNTTKIVPVTSRANVALHLTEVPIPPDRVLSLLEEKRRSEKFWVKGEGSERSARWCIVGIDVDDYEEGGKKKHGGRTLRELEEKLGKLPETWTSSSRSDGVSGIRFFLSPTDYQYSGIVGPSIEVVQAGHRFAVCWPSAHPTAGQYTWFGPGQAPQGAPGQWFRLDGDGNGHLKPVARTVPSVWTLPLLPRAWVEHITKGFTKYTRAEIDMESSVDEIFDWAKKNFRKPSGSRRLVDLEKIKAELDTIGCSFMRKRAEIRAKEAVELEDSHVVLMKMHKEFLNLGLEGHSGWMSAIRYVETIWIEHCLGNPEFGGEDGGKRGVEEMRGEVFRSITGELRKIKAKNDKSIAESGGSLTGRTCGCYEDSGEDDSDDSDSSGSGSGGSEFSITKPSKDPNEYEHNDDGNGEHFVDLYREKFHYVSGYDRWIYWNESQRTWVWAENGMVERAFWAVKKRQFRYAKHLYQLMMSEPDDQRRKALAKKWEEASGWAKRSGNVSQVRNALEAASNRRGVTLKSDEFDCNEQLLGVKNGIVELRADGVNFRQAEREDLVVTNTGVPYVSTEEILGGSSPLGTFQFGLELWTNFLNIFLPNLEERLWTQQLMGMCLIGGNPSKKFIFLHGESHTGKSTFLNLLMAALGEYAGSAEMSIFDSSKLNPALARALPWRLLTTTEANALGGSGGRGGHGGLEGDMLKRLTGNDKMSAELKGVNTIIERVPAFTPVVATNTAPQIENIDEALRERVEVIPFRVRQDPNEAPIGIEDLMKEHALPVVLSWLVEGWKLYASDRLRNRPGSMQAVKAAFGREMSGDIGAFMEDCLELTGVPEDIESVKNVYQAYKNWAREQNVQDNQIWNNMQFGRRMAKAGYSTFVKKIEGKGERCYRGLKITARGKTLTFKVNGKG